MSGVFYFITGGSGSGKSAYAEKLCLALRESRVQDGEKPSLVYAATMRIFDGEGREKVKKHRLRRAGMGFATVESPELSFPDFEGYKDSIILLEDTTNLAMNLFYSGVRDPAAIADRALALRKLSRALIAVSCELSSDGIRYSPETEDFLTVLAGAERILADRADAVTEVVFGIPVPVKKPAQKGAEWI